jgi:hypothetical protein
VRDRDCADAAVLIAEISNLDGMNRLSKNALCTDGTLNSLEPDRVTVRASTNRLEIGFHFHGTDSERCPRINLRISDR